MSSHTETRERVRHWSIIAYLAMLALLLPLTLFVIKQEQHVQTRAATKNAVVTATPEPTEDIPMDGVMYP